MANFTALIVEDDADIQIIYREALRAADYQVTVVQTGEEALAYLDTNEPDLTVLDMHLLDDVSGETLLKHIRSEPRLARTRVIIATADDRTGETLRNTADLVLLKPISFTLLRDLAKRLQTA